MNKRILIKIAVVLGIAVLAYFIYPSIKYKILDGQEITVEYYVNSDGEMVEV